MVGAFSDYVLLKFLQPQEKKLKGQDEEGGGSDAVSCGSPVTDSLSSGEEEERVGAEEFLILPIEHPVEPPDDDRPAKFPLSDYSFDGDEEAEEETFAESLRKRLQSSSVDGERHQISSTRDAAAAAASSPSKGSQYNIFHMCKEL